MASLLAASAPVNPGTKRRNKFVVLSTQSCFYFGRKLAEHLNCPLLNVVRKTFGDGEQYYRIDIRDRNELVGLDAIYVSSTANDSDLMELFRVGCELAALGTRRRIFIIPFLGYSTMERAVLPGEIVSAKMNARMLSAIPNSGLGNIFMLCDLHVSGLLQYFEGQCQRMELYAERFLVEAISANVDFSKGDVMFGSADLGRPLWVESFAKRFKTDIAFIRKSRRFETVSVVGTPIGDVSGKRVIIYDDMTRSATTLINAAQSYLDHGAKEILAVLSHFALNNESVVQLLEKSCISKVITTNSHPMSQLPAVLNSTKFVVCDITPVFAETVEACGLFDNGTPNGETFCRMQILAVLSHFALRNESVVQLLEKSCISKVITTNSHPMSQLPAVLNSTKFVVCDITPVFAETVEACGLFDNGYH